MPLIRNVYAHNYIKNMQTGQKALNRFELLH